MEYPENISRRELLRSSKADELGLLNVPVSREHEVHLRNTAWWLQGLRNKLKEKFDREFQIIVSSGYRTPALNTAIKGSRTSSHMKGLAADFRVPGLTVAQVVQFIIEEANGYDQVINEYDSWVHIGLPRKQALKATRLNGKTKYELL
ncbi:putative Endolysin gp23 [Vibrio coralliirubri]|uniref:D-Ala-D-Ala carboxypeptidase family metallohydrolase n=1 Tax=Vibrio coralliirubri TaxID=1516159 RepID=UPI00063A1F8D|nr:D-Ala-D-Ala carboxypeptidase family metallohydrolase [Vibrio coralliirubri]CDT54076.1 putative Endolysin gp23 [Vibrio coralliirubri]